MGKLACGIWTDLLLKTVVIVYGMPLWSSISTICRQFFLSCACLRVVKSPKFWVAKSAFIVLDQVVIGLPTGCFRCLGGLNIVAYWALVWSSPGLDLGTCPNKCNPFYRHEFNWEWALTRRAPEDFCIGLVYSVMCTKQSSETPLVERIEPLVQWRCQCPCFCSINEHWKYVDLVEVDFCVELDSRMQNVSIKELEADTRYGDLSKTVVPDYSTLSQTWRNCKCKSIQGEQPVQGF